MHFATYCFLQMLICSQNCRPPLFEAVIEYKSSILWSLRSVSQSCAKLAPAGSSSEGGEKASSSFHSKEYVCSPLYLDSCAFVYEKAKKSVKPGPAHMNEKIYSNTFNILSRWQHLALCARLSLLFHLIHGVCAPPTHSAHTQCLKCWHFVNSHTHTLQLQLFKCKRTQLCPAGNNNGQNGETRILFFPSLYFSQRSEWMMTAMT